MVVLGVGPEMLGELLDALGQQGDLHFGRARIALAPPVVADERASLFFGECHLDRQ